PTSSSRAFTFASPLTRWPRPRVVLRCGSSRHTYCLRSGSPLSGQLSRQAAHPHVYSTPPKILFPCIPAPWPHTFCLPLGGGCILQTVARQCSRYSPTCAAAPLPKSYHRSYHRQRKSLHNTLITNTIQTA